MDKNYLRHFGNRAAAGVAALFIGATAITAPARSLPGNGPEEIYTYESRGKNIFQQDSKVCDFAIVFKDRVVTGKVDDVAVVFDFWNGKLVVVNKRDELSALVAKEDSMKPVTPDMQPVRREYDPNMAAAARKIRKVCDAPEATA